MTRTLSLVLFAGILAAAGCDNPSATPPVANKNANTSAKEDAKIKANLDKLSPEDRDLAEQQRVCPVSGEKLGSMGVPIKMMVKDKPVFICCKGCEKEVKEKPDETLKKAEELKAKNGPK